MSCCVLVGDSIECLDDDVDDDPLRDSGDKKLLLFRLNDGVVGDVTDFDGRNAITPPPLLMFLHRAMIMMMNDVNSIGRLIVTASTASSSYQ